MIRDKTLQLILTASAGILSASPVLAQQQIEPTDQPRAEAKDASGAPSASRDEERPVLEQIIVTGTRRAENLTDVPISVSVLTAESLERAGVADTSEFYKLTPGLQLAGSHYLTPSLRGVTSDTISVGLSSNVAIYLDGIYQAAQAGQLMELPDVERIEVLKGPQGTLYGQNATGGAIVITTLSPQFDFNGKASVSYGNYNDMALRGFVTGPITDTIAASLSATYQNRDGFRRHAVTGERDPGLDSVFVRGKLLLQPSDNASITLTAYYGDREDGSARAGIIWQDQSIARMEAPELIANARWNNYTSQPGATGRVKPSGASVHGDFDVGTGSLRFTTSYTSVDDESFTDIDYTLLNAWEADGRGEDESFVQTVDFISNRIDALDFTVGAFYQHREADYLPSLVNLYSLPPFVPTTTIYPEPPPTPAMELYSVVATRLNIYAAYAEAGLNLLEDRLRLTAGGRYSYQRQESYFNNSIRGAALVEHTFSPADWSNFSPRLTASYSLDDQSNLYVSYSEGFKSGLFYPPVLASAPVDPEILTSYEVGYKGSPTPWFYMELAAFYYDYDDLQVVSWNGSTAVVQNAATSKIKGLDFATSLQVTPAFTLSAGFEVLDAEWQSFPAASVYIDAPNGYGLQQTTADLSGQRMFRAPAFTANVNANYLVATAIGEFEANASIYFSEEQRLELTGRVTDPSYSLLDAQLSYSPANLPGARFVLWGKNLTNEAHLTNITQTQVGAGITYAPPRQYGARVEFKF